MQKWIILAIIILIIVLGIFIVSNVSVETEYTPETEVEDIELRKTIVTLYFKEKDSGELAKETRFIDSKELLKNPYDELINLLISGPENTNFDKIIPDNVTLLNTEFKNGCVTVNFSKELEESNVEKSVFFDSIFKTLTELTEVTNVVVLSDGDLFYENSNLSTSNTSLETNMVNSALTNNI